MMVFDEKTGELLWQLVVPKLVSGKVNDWEGMGICASPTLRVPRPSLSPRWWPSNGSTA